MSLGRLWLSEIDQEVLSLCEVEAIDEEIERSEEVTASILHLKGKIENASKVNTSTQQHVESFQAATQLASHAVVFTGVVLPSSPQTPAYPSLTFLSHCFTCETI